jgi:hypothetical protein
MTKKNRIYLLISLLVIFVIATFLIILVGDTVPTKIEEQNTKISSNIEEGKKLSKIHCTSCHTYPEAGLLHKKAWKEQTLPHMGPQLGIFEYNGNKYPVERTPNLPENYYPSEQQLSNDDWQKILDYYISSAPQELKREGEYSPIVEDSLFFRARTPGFRGQTPPMVSSIRFDPGNKLIYLSDASYSMFYVFNENLEFKDRYRLSSAISDIQFTNSLQKSGKRELLTTYIGDVNPSDARSGFIQMVWYEPDAEQGGAGEVLYDNLARPVESQFADLDQDGLTDILVNEFAHRTGKLFWLKNRGENREPDQQILSESSGCIESHILDYTGNGLPDIFALCTQLDQSIYLFRNQGNGNFNRERLLQFPITYGSSSFKLHDFNNDGHLDILYTSGDNADYSIIYKPYHGVYIYINDGSDNFTKEWFYPINGAYNAIARDFDKDGHLDIAAISFFANYQEIPEESFVFFKGNDNLDFSPYHHPAASAGRWITMDVADWTGDGYDDIVLANFSQGPTRVVDNIQNKWLEGPHFLLLENIADLDM